MEHFFSRLWKLLNDASKLIAPQRCVLCGRRLRSEEKLVCLNCYALLPFTMIKGRKDNSIERYFLGQFAIQRANAFLHYLPHSDSSRLFLQMKYGNRPQIGYVFGRYIARDLIDTDFFDSIDCIVPVPLSKERFRQRGYNQSEELAKGINSLTKIPVDTHSVIRTVFKQTQTQLNAEERKANVKDAFALSHQQTLDNRHVLLVDDILTTGATIISCAKEIMKAKNVKISVVTLGLTKTHFAIERKNENIGDSPQREISEADDEELFRENDMERLV